VKKKIVYKAGDILTACDNELSIPDGILGHSAIVINKLQMIEAVVSPPYLQKASIHKFTKNHPKHAIYRPKNPAWGKAAAKFARSYLVQKNYYKQLGIERPPFSFSPQLPLSDPWSSIYCSKLIWLCYHYGAGHTFNNDHFLFSPQDLDTLLRKDSNFKTLFRHRRFKFIIDT